MWDSKRDYDNLARLLANSFQNNMTMMINRDNQKAGSQFKWEESNVYT